MQIVATNDKPKKFHPFCKKCGWRMGGVDSWDGKSCKCGHDAPPMVWQGCTHLDCLPECRHSLENPHCERFARYTRAMD